MKRFRNVLVLAPRSEGSQVLLGTAGKLVRQSGASLTLFDVVNSRKLRNQPLPAGRNEGVGPLGAADDRLEELRSMGSDVGLGRFGVSVTTGAVVPEVLRRVEEFEHDLVMVTATSPREIIDAKNLVRLCPVPVWVEAGTGEGSPHIAVAIEPSDETDGASDLNVALLEIGSSLAGLKGGRLDVIVAWRLSGESLMRGRRLSISDDEVDAMAQEARRLAHSSANELIGRIVPPGAPYQLHLWKGYPEVVIPELLNELGSAVVVMGVAQRNLLQRALVTSVTRRVVASRETSVLAISV